MSVKIYTCAFHSDIYIDEAKLCIEALKKNGKFIFTVFEAKQKDIELNSFLLYSHSNNYITSLADRLKFKINYNQISIHEYHKDDPINALIYEFQKNI